MDQACFNFLGQIPNNFVSEYVISASKEPSNKQSADCCLLQNDIIDILIDEFPVQYARSSCNDRDLLIIEPNNVVKSLFPNIDLNVEPLGTGFFALDVPDNLVTGGLCRGQNAVDLQFVRSLSTQVASGTQSVILSGGNNEVAGDNGIVMGGLSNTVSMLNSVIVAGSNNMNLSTESVIVGGTLHNMTGPQSVIIAGNTNSVTSQHSVICSGTDNSVTDTQSSIISGNTNSVTNGMSIVGGGTNHSITGTNSGIITGDTNLISGNNSSILSGSNLIVTGNNSTIMASNNVTNSGSTSAIITQLGTVISVGATVTDSIIGGFDNRIKDDFIRSAIMNADSYLKSSAARTATDTFFGCGSENESFNILRGGIVSGVNGILLENDDLIFGGRVVLTSGPRASLAGGDNCTSGGANAFLGAGNSNGTAGDNCAICCGNSLIIFGSESFSGAGAGTTIDGQYDAIFGGSTCAINDGCYYSFLGSGSQHTVGERDWSVIFAGQQNTMFTIATNATYSVMGAGNINMSRGLFDAVPGGDGIVIGSSVAFTPTHATAAGRSHIIDGNYSILLGNDGDDNENNNTFLFAGSTQTLPGVPGTLDGTFWARVTGPLSVPNAVTGSTGVRLSIGESGTVPMTAVIDAGTTIVAPGPGSGQGTWSYEASGALAGNWNTVAPVNVADAVNRMAIQLSGLLGASIP